LFLYKMPSDIEKKTNGSAVSQSVSNPFV